MNRSKLTSDVSIFIVNSSHASVDGFMAVLSQQIKSGQRPHVACITQEEIGNASNPREYIENCIDERAEECRVTMEKLKRFQEFNQLDEWKSEVNLTKEKNQKRLSKRIKGGFKNQSTLMKRDCAQSLIIDSPKEHQSIKLYLIAFDVYDCNIIESIASIDSSFKALVNLYPRMLRNDNESSIKSKEFWDELLRLKYSKAFDDIAFLDLDVPIESEFMLNLRSKLIYDQFCHFVYDIEDIKSCYKDYSQRLEIAQVDVNEEVEDLQAMRKRLDEIPESMITVEVIYDAILEQVSNENGSHKSPLKATLRKPFKVEMFEKNFFDSHDKWVEAYRENPQCYGKRVEKLEDSLKLWVGTERVTIEKRQLLNFFMAKVLNKLKSLENFEFHIYWLQLKIMEKPCETSSKAFYENRSVGVEKNLLDMKASASDSLVEYRNQSKIPEDISQLIDDRTMTREQFVENFVVSLLSPAAIFQRLTDLKRRYKSFSQKHSQLMDVMLVKFHCNSTPEMFTTKTYCKVLPTPLCFRDFNDFFNHEMQEDVNANESVERQTTLNVISLADYILPSSMKHRNQFTKSEHQMQTSLISEEVEKVPVEQDIQVFNVSNRRIQFDVVESEFNSLYMNAKASTFSWLNHEKLLNFSSQLGDLFLSISHDLIADKLQVVTLLDECGMRCSLEKKKKIQGTTQDDEQCFINRWSISLSLPNGLAIKTLSKACVEQSWMETEMEGKSPDGEVKRVLFANGFVVIAFVDGVKRVLAANGSTFEVIERSPGSRKSQKKSIDKRATKLFQDSIASVHFLNDIIDLNSYKMTMPNGETFIVENDSIIEKLDTIQSVEMVNNETGSVHVVRADGLKILYTEAFSKSLFPDGSLITTWTHDNSIITTSSDEPNIVRSILDEISSRNESQFVVNHVLNRISDNYFLSAVCSHKFEHSNYGAVHFGESLNIEMFNGTTLEARSDRFIITRTDDVTFAIDDFQLRLIAAKCNECFRSNEAFMNLADEGDDENNALAGARDCHGNTFEIKRNGRHAFYVNDSYDTRECSRCRRVKNNYDVERYGERCIVVNRDYSGYEITAINETNLDAFTEARGEMLSCEDSSQMFRHSIYVKDVNIDIRNVKKPPANDDDISTGVKPKRSSESVASQSQRRQKKGKTLKAMVESSETLKPSPWLTESQSISLDVSPERRKLIQFYDNPLDEVPDPSTVKAMIKVNNKSGSVFDALLHLKKYSIEKFIFNVNGLMEMPAGKREFGEHFELVVRKTVENHIDEKLKRYRKLLAEAVIGDLLDIAIGSEDKVESDTEISSSVAGASRLEDSNVSVAAVGLKAFSFS